MGEVGNVGRGHVVVVVVVVEVLKVEEDESGDEGAKDVEKGRFTLGSIILGCMFGFI
jgi:hypothetical protein